MSGSETFNFTIEQAGHIANADEGPQMDETGSRNGHFAYISSGNGNAGGSQAEIETPMIHGANHLIECFHFWFALKV